jgi:hypothetical protein
MTVTRAIVLFLLMLNAVTAVKAWQYREAAQRKDQAIARSLRSNTITSQAPR